MVRRARLRSQLGEYRHAMQAADGTATTLGVRRVECTNLVLVPAMAALVVFGALEVHLVVLHRRRRRRGYEAHAYWLAGKSAHPYQGAPLDYDAFLFSPVFALLMRALALLPWVWFAAVWITAETCEFVWLVSPLRWLWQIPLLLVCIPEIDNGQHLRVPWCGHRRGNALAGGVGVCLPYQSHAWWSRAALVRRSRRVEEGHACGRRHPGRVDDVPRHYAGAVEREWIGFLIHHGSDSGARVPMLVAVAAVLTVVAARPEQAWLLCVAMTIAVLTLMGRNKDLAMLVAGPRTQNELSAPTSATAMEFACAADPSVSPARTRHAP